MVLMVLAFGGGAVALVAIDAGLSVVVFVANASYALRTLGARFAILPFDPALVRGVFCFSAWVFVFAMIGQFQWQTGQLVLGATSGPEDVAVYGVGILLGTYYGAFSTALTSLFMPRATRMTVTGSDARMLTAETARIGRLALFVLLPILGGFACFGYEFVRLWAGQGFEASWSVALIIMLVYTLPLAQSFANQLLEARGLFAFKAKVYLAALPAGVWVGFLLSRTIGVMGMAAGIAIGWGVALAVMNIYYQRTLGLHLPTFFKVALHGIGWVFLIVLVVGFALRSLSGEGWLVLGFKVLLFSVFYALMMFRFGMNAGERGEVESMIKRISWIRA